MVRELVKISVRELVEFILPKSVRKIGDFAFRNTVCKFSKEKLSDADEIDIDSLKSSIGMSNSRFSKTLFI